METDINAISEGDFERIIVKLEMADKELSKKNILKVYNEALKARAYCRRIARGAVVINKEAV